MNVNKFQYHRYYVGNAASMDVALDVVGQEEAARRCLLYARKMQSPTAISDSPDANSSGGGK